MSLEKCASCGNDLFDEIQGDHGIVNLNAPIGPNSMVFPVDIYVCTKCETVLLKPNSKAKR